MSKSRNRIFGALAAVIPFVVYVITLAPTVTFVDSGELATVASKLGIAHPTGYPLFTILGRIFTLIPIGDEIYRLNLMCAVISSASLFIFYNLMRMLIGSEHLLDDSQKPPVLTETVVCAISLSATLILAFSKTFWDISNALEVYSLHAFFVITSMYLIVKASGSNYAEESGAGEKYWLLYSFVLGLSFTNHLSMIFLSVGSIYLYFAVNGFSGVSFRRVLILVIPFLAGYSVYAYLFVRAENEVISWGYPHNFDNFWRHFTGKQFSLWMFTSFENAGKQFSYFIKSYPSEFAYLPLLIAVFGLFRIYRRSRKLFIFTFLLFAFCILYAINYDITDIDSYFILAYIVSAVWIGFGILLLAEKVGSAKPAFAYALPALAILPLIVNFSIENQSRNFFVKDYTSNVFASAPPNSIILSSQWSFWISPSLYEQHVKGNRKDIAVIDKRMLRQSWYMHYLKTHYPELYERSRQEFEIYLAELIKFEKNPDRYKKPVTDADRRDLKSIQTAFVNLLNSIVDNNYQDRSFFTTYEIEKEETDKFGADYGRVPQGLLIRYLKGKDYDGYEMPEMKFDVTQADDYHHNFLMSAYYYSFLSRGTYLANLGKLDEAEQMINRAIQIKPDLQDGRQLLAKLKQMKSQQGSNSK